MSQVRVEKIWPILEQGCVAAACAVPTPTRVRIAYAIGVATDRSAVHPRTPRLG